LFDTTNLAEITSPDHAGERLLACYNPLLAEERGRKLQALLAATEKDLTKISNEVARRKNKPLSASQIALKVGKVQGRYKVSKHFSITIAEGSFRCARREDAIREEAALDGIYVLRTSESAERISAPDTVGNYKSLVQVERMFRSLKDIDLLVRLIRHRSEERVPAQIFLCLLAYYLEWHTRQALAPMLFEDEQLPADRKRRDPILPAQPSPATREKKIVRQTADGLPVHSFETLMAELAARSRVTCGLKSEAKTSVIFQQLPPHTPLQAKAYRLLGLLPVARN
jgi:hypothetical protein